MTDETLRAFLERRERELTNQIAALQGAVREKEVELAQVRIAKERVDAAGMPDAAFGVKIGDKNFEADSTGVDSFQRVVVDATNKMFGPDATKLSIKSLIQRALSNRVSQGATAAQLADFIKDAYGRDVQPDSLRAQLARSKAEGMVEQRNGEWFLTLAGKLFDHPTSWPDKEPT